MRREAAKMFCCLKCGGPLRLASVAAEDAASMEIVEAQMECGTCRLAVPVVRSLPRFVPSESYAASFGFQWNRFEKIQIDKFMHNDLSCDRFRATTGWPSNLAGQQILEAGCGAGRFTQLALETGAEVYSFDLSSAVEAAYRNNSGASNLTTFQASIYEIPLRKGVFDRIFCMGVLQHCPDVAGAFHSLVPFLRPGGEIVIDVYEKERGFPPLKYLARPFVKNLSTDSIYNLLRWTIPPAFELKKLLYRIPIMGPGLGALIPIGPISHAPRLNYTDDELKQVKILSALDMLSPAYDQPQSMEDVQKWFEDAGFVDIQLKRGYNGINAKGKRPI